MGKLKRLATGIWLFRRTGIWAAMAVGTGLYGAILIAHNSQSTQSSNFESPPTAGPATSVLASKMADVSAEITQLQVAVQQTEKNLVEHQISNPSDLETTESVLRQSQEARLKLEKLDTEYTLLQDRRDQLQLRLAAIPRNIPVKPSPAQQNLNALLKKLGVLYRQYPDGHPDITAMERLVLKARKVSERETRNGRGGKIAEINPAYERLQEQIGDVTEQMEGIQKRSTVQGEKFIKLRARLERTSAAPRERQLLQSRLDLLSQNLRQKRIHLDTLKITDPVTMPAVAVPLPHGKVIPAVLAAALTAGLGAAYLRARRSNNFFTPSDLQGATGLPILGAVSRVSKATWQTVDTPNSRGIGTGNQEFVLDVERLQAQGLIAVENDQSPLGKEIRLIKRRLLRRMSAPRTNNSIDDRGREHVILVTSAGEDAGKSVLAANLALSMVLEDDLNVLLIDANAAGLPLTSLIGARSGPGLSNLLAAKPPVLSKVLVEERNHPLTFLPPGTAHWTAPDIYSNANLSTLIGHIARRYRDRVIIINGPALSASAEPVVLTGQIGQTVMVVDAENASRKSVEKALGRMSTHENVTLILSNTPPI